MQRLGVGNGRPPFTLLSKQYINHMETTQRFARICSATNEGMNEGYLFEESLMYFIEREDAERFAIGQGYADLDEAYDDGAYCYTEWDWEDEGEWYEKHDGQWYECTEDSKVLINNN